MSSSWVGVWEGEVEGLLLGIDFCDDEATLDSNDVASSESAVI